MVSALQTPSVNQPHLFGQIAQLVEQRIENPRVGGSIPSLATIHIFRFFSLVLISAKVLVAVRKTIRQSNYTFTKRGVYYFSRRISEDLQQYYQQLRIIRSLRAKRHKDLITAAQLFSNQLEQLWFQLRLQKTQQLSNLGRFQQQIKQFTLEQALACNLEQKNKTRSELSHKHSRLYICYLQAAVSSKTKPKQLTTRDALIFHNWLQANCLSNTSMHKLFAIIRAIFNMLISLPDLYSGL